MRVKNQVHKRECVECLFTEINILTECRHPNVVKILDASFDGTMIKEQMIELKRKHSSGHSSKKGKNPNAGAK